MDRVTVYHFWHYDGITDQSVRSPTKRTAEQIRQMGCEVIPDTAEDVASGQLDDNGRYDPRKSQQG